MPGASGMSLLQQLRDQNARLPVIMLTGYGDIQMSVNAMKLGAVDFLTKPFNQQQLLDRIQEVLRNTSLRDSVEITGIDPRVARERWESLTPREQEIASRIANGASNKSIAYDLGISVRTVESHRANLMGKLQANSVVELVQLALTLKQAS
jgi:two-component system response regulator FixJ